MKPRTFLPLILLATVCTVDALAADAADPIVERGRYLVSVAGCNDCHTDGYMQNDGKVPEALRLMGSVVGFSGPWGVTYPSNLRLVAAKLDEAGWLARVRREGQPPMPWASLRAMSEDDLVAVFQYLRHLGPGGEAAPPALAPGQPIPTPYVVFVPQPPQRVTSAVSR